MEVFTDTSPQIHVSTGEGSFITQILKPVNDYLNEDAVNKKRWHRLRGYTRHKHMTVLGETVTRLELFLEHENKSPGYEKHSITLNKAQSQAIRQDRIEASSEAGRALGDMEQVKTFFESHTQLKAAVYDTVHELIPKGASVLKQHRVQLVCLPKTGFRNLELHHVDVGEDPRKKIASLKRTLQDPSQHVEPSANEHVAAELHGESAPQETSGQSVAQELPAGEVAHEKPDKPGRFNLKRAGGLRQGWKEGRQENNAGEGSSGQPKGE